MFRRVIVAAGISAASLGGIALVAAPAAHASQVCYNLNANVGGNQIVNQDGCQTLP